MLKSDTIALYLFRISILMLVFGIALFLHHNNYFPVPMLHRVWSHVEALYEEASGQLSWYYIESVQSQTTVGHKASAPAPGLTLVSGISQDEELSVKVISANGVVIHKWDIDWFKIWPEQTHIPDHLVPKSRPGTIVHGVVLTNNGDLVFNFENLGLVRLDICGNVVWRLPYLTHHSVHLDESGNFWVGGWINHTQQTGRIPAHKPPFREFTVLEISPEGRIITEISVYDLLKRNRLAGLIYMTATGDHEIMSSGDTLHLNDVETFPSTLEDGVFKRGDIMISLRDINTIIVFEPVSWKIRYTVTGEVLRQHDPDFLDGNTISVFDNNNSHTDLGSTYSRIVKISAISRQVIDLFSGNETTPFFSNVMGKHQLLQNGNILITESTKGRAFEVDLDGNIIWEYFNIVGDNILGIISEAQRLPAIFNKDFFDTTSARCESP